MKLFFFWEAARRAAEGGGAKIGLTAWFLRGGALVMIAGVAVWIVPPAPWA